MERLRWAKTLLPTIGDSGGLSRIHHAIPKDFTVREATRADLPAVLEIFNERIQNSTASFYYEPVTLAERQAWWLDLQKDGYPVIVALDNAKERPVAYANLSSFRNKPAYRMTAEITVYVHQDYHGKGLGRALINELLRATKEMNIKSVVASIAAGNDASIALFKAVGFKLVGTFHENGFKFGKFHDMHFYELINEEVICTTGKAQFRSFPWGNYLYGEPLFGQGVQKG